MAKKPLTARRAAASRRAKKPTAKKAPSRRPARTGIAAKKTAAKKTLGKKTGTVSKPASRKKISANKASSKKSVDKPVAAKKTVPKRASPTRRPAAKLPLATAIVLGDVSGSIGGERERLRIDLRTLQRVLVQRYLRVKWRFVAYDFEARDVTLDDIFAEQGLGTQMSIGYARCAELLTVAEGDVFVLHASDGDNWSLEDTELALDTFANQILPRVRMFVYAELGTAQGERSHLGDLERRFGFDPRVLLVRLAVGGEAALVIAGELTARRAAVSGRA